MRGIATPDDENGINTRRPFRYCLIMPRLRRCIAVAAFALYAGFAIGQTSQPAEADADYAKMIDERADKILAPLALDADKAAVVKPILLKHYRDLRAWDADAGLKLKALQIDLAAATKTGDTAAVDRLKAEAAGVRGTKTPMHEQFIRDLVRVIPFTKVNAIKDTMTYNNVQLRAGIMEKLDLTDEQRTEIRDMLVATREQAMDAGSSDEKAKMFLETVGRISLRVLTPEQNAGLKALQKRPSSKPAASRAN